MSNLETVELVFRGGAVGGFLGLAIAVGRGPFSRARATGILFCFGAVGHTLTQMPEIMLAVGWAIVPVWIFSVMGAGLFWAFVSELFEDRAPFQALRLLPAAALLVISICAVVAPRAAREIWLVRNILGVILAAHAFFIVVTGWRDDLVEPRRRLRGPLLAVAATYALTVTIVESSAFFLRPVQMLSPFAAIILFGLSLAAAFAFLRADPELFGPARQTREPSLGRKPQLAAEDGPAAAIERVMRDDKLYREAGLTIATLAVRLGLPEHRVRQIINQRMGYRNFSAFLNHQRIEEAKLALADPTQSEVPISTIAFDAGFQSLGPFNRAFKAETGLTPTEFRAGAHADRSPVFGSLTTTAI